MNLLFKYLIAILNIKSNSQLSLSGLSILLSLLIAPTVTAADLPSTTGLQFQTSSPNRCANIGDWYTTDGSISTPNCNTDATSDDRKHRFNIDITQEMLDATGGIVSIIILDAESTAGGADIDEISGGVSDPTRFELFDPTGFILDSEITASGSPNGTNIVFTVNAPGTYQLTSETGARFINGNNAPELNDDDNSFRIQVPNAPNAATDPKLRGLIGQFQGTMQQNTGSPLSFDAYTLVGPGTNALQIRNFDVDNRASFIYTNPGDNPVGSPTVSGNGVWNGGGNLNTGGDSFAISNAAPGFSDTGIWKIDVNNLSNNNQFILEANTGSGDRLIVYDNLPVRAGNFTITPDTTRTVKSGQTTDHPFTVTNLFATTDIINLSLSGTDPNYTVTLLYPDGTPLPDTDDDDNLDTGIIDPNQSLELILRVTHSPPPMDDESDPPNDITQINGISFMDTKVDPENNTTKSVTKTTIFDPLATITSPNPEYTKGCGTGIKIALILDASGSINFVPTGVQSVRDGVTQFINTINTIAPGTEIGIVEFGFTSDTPIGFTAVDPISIANTFLPYIDSTSGNAAKEYYDGRIGGSTNWEAAFRDVQGQTTNINAPVNPLLTDADAVIFVTDGNPNRYINNAGSIRSNGTVDLKVNEAVPWTNEIKQSGTHIYGFGISARSTDDPVDNFFPITDGASSIKFVVNPDGTDNAESADYAFVDEFGLFGQGLVDLVGGICGKRPNVSVVKRIAAVNRGQFADERNFDNYYVDVTPANDPDNANADNITKWPGLLVNPQEGTNDVKDYLQGEVFDTVVPGDEVEYSIYFLSNGNKNAKNVLICDILPENGEFVVDAYSPRTTNPRASNQNGLSGAGRGILLEFNNETKSLTSGKDGDVGYYFPPGVDPASAFPNIQCGDHTTPNSDPNQPNVANNHGAVVVDLGELPFANNPGNPRNSYGSIRFRIRVK